MTDLDVMRYTIRKEREMSYFYNDWTTKPTSYYTYMDGKTVLEFMGSEYVVNHYEMSSDGELIINAEKIHPPTWLTVGPARINYSITEDRICSVSLCGNPKDKYQIKKVVVNPSKNATTVIFEDGTVEVVKKSPDDPEADIFSVVAYAVAKHVYGSNSAFKREVLKNLDFIDREFEEIINRTPVEDLQKAMNKIVEHIKKKNRKEEK